MKFSPILLLLICTVVARAVEEPALAKRQGQGIPGLERTANGRVMFGKREDVGQFESQAGKTPEPLPPQDTTANSGETLYNGLVLPEVWPPREPVMKAGEPMPVPWLAHPPAVIPIDVGRQLLVDDFLIESTTMQREHHAAVLYEGNPVLKPETPAELERQSSDGHAFQRWRVV